MSVLKGRRKAYLVLLGLALVIVAALVSGCGGSSSSSSSGGSQSTSAESESGTGASGNAAQEQAQALVKKYEAEQPPIKVPKLGKPVPQGVSVAIIGCPIPVCTEVTEGSEAAIKELAPDGWSFKSYEGPLTPEGYSAVWTNVLRTNPEAIIYIGGNLPDSTITSQLEEAKERNIPAVGIANAEVPKEGSVLPAVYNGPPEFEESGRLMGALVAAEAGSEAKAEQVDPQLPTIATTRTEIKKEIEAAGGSVETLNTSLEEIGKGIPPQLVTFLQSHPETNYVLPIINDMTAGIPQALEAAGLAEKVKIISRAPSTSALQEIKSGAQYASIAEETESNGWRSVDAVIRLLNGEEIPERRPAGWHQILTTENITDTSQLPQTPGVPQAFLTAWGVK